MSNFPLFQADGYKVSHKKFTAPGTTKLFANMTPRSGKYAKWASNKHEVVTLGIQRFVERVLIDQFNEGFFWIPEDRAVATFSNMMDLYLGVGSVSTDHIRELHKLGYLPIELKGLPEGSKSPIGVPVVMFTNTDDDFAWLVTYLETVISQELWPTITAATIAMQFKILCDSFAAQTCDNALHVPFQCHDFSARGLMGQDATAMVGMGHLLSFIGTDSINAISEIENVYGSVSGAPIGVSVPASEHSVTSLGTAVMGEEETIRWWIEECYPAGIVSVVADTYSYWDVLENTLPKLKDVIIARKADANGMSKITVRADSGDPVRIICGYREDEIYRDRVPMFSEIDGLTYKTVIHCRATSTPLTESEVKGSIEVLWEKFGGTVNNKGFRVLDTHIGLIYGDSITLERADEIFRRLQQRGFASSNVVFGVGSYTYQMVSRDTYGIAIKVTAAVVNGELVEIYKDPKTDSGMKKSAKGVLAVKLVDGEYQLLQQQKIEDFGGDMVVYFKDGAAYNYETFDQIRDRYDGVLKEEE